jgi:para-aminobenzoate synthetase component 1
VDDLQLPDARFGLYDWALVSDHQAPPANWCFTRAGRQRAAAADQPVRPAGAAPLMPFKLHTADDCRSAPDDYRQAIERIHNTSRRATAIRSTSPSVSAQPASGDPWLAYCALREACPTPFSGFQSLPDGDAVLSLSPERFVKVSQRQVETRPIKGTRPRGLTPAEDAANAAELLASPKDRAENLMIVDLLRNDLGRTCRIGSVRVPELFSLESYPNVHHLVSSVTGELADDRDALDLIAGSFPGGSITGAPKIRAMQIIDELEPTRRGLYCGSLLYLDVRGEMDSSIAIRSLLVKDGQVCCWGAAGSWLIRIGRRSIRSRLPRSESSSKPCKTSE